MESQSGQPTGTPVVSAPARKKGRPRIHKTNASKQQRYRARIARKHGKALNEEIDYGKPDPVPPTQQAPVQPECSLDVDNSEGNKTRWQVYKAALKVYSDLWDEYLRAAGLGMSRGCVVTDAPHGKGRLVCGGFDQRKIQEIDAAEQASQGAEAYIARPS
jgi:hypothetical protein